MGTVDIDGRKVVARGRYGFNPGRAGLAPILWSHGTGADVMKRIVVDELNASLLVAG